MAQNLLRSGTVQIEEVPYLDQHKAHGETDDDGLEKSNRTYRSGSLWIDPDTHQAMRKNTKGEITRSVRIYAVGSMTRGQIIDASMAYGSAVSTACIADDIIGYLKNTNNHKKGPK